jgi:hypothetical protein
MGEASLGLVPLRITSHPAMVTSPNTFGEVRSSGRLGSPSCLRWSVATRASYRDLALRV